MTIISQKDVETKILCQLQFDPTRQRLVSSEVLAALLRRAGSFRCPCSTDVLAQSVAEPLHGIVNDDSDAAVRIQRVLEQLVAYGDFVEVDESSDDHTHKTVLYTVPPSFVTFSSGRILLLGVAPDDMDLLPFELAPTLQRRAHMRVLLPSGKIDTRESLKSAGYFEVPERSWLQSPRSVPARKAVDDFISLLKESNSPETMDFTILDTAESVRYYKGRWKPPASLNGYFVARRPQIYGAPLWCFVKLSTGRLCSIVDLPIEVNRWRGCDEAWHLQAAIDAFNGSPQIAELAESSSGMVLMRFFSPLPMWAQRHLDVFGERVEQPGALFTYEIPAAETQPIRQFLEQSLWMWVVNS